ncbi:MAG: S8 family serine peptidase [Flavobacteriales bacterium]|nr:S8 family serine peptidase [Flavobacteriales bacterium]
MKHLLSAFIVLLAINISVAQQKPQIVPGNIIVQVPNGQIDKVITENQSFNGIPTNLKLNRLLSAPMAAYLLEFNENIHHQQFLQQLWNDENVSLIQLNHYVFDRETTPNDPQFDNQWWHVNDGSGSATADADIDSDEAWDITTGGVTALGDTIVVCVVDDGGDLDHPDLIANNWVNYHEIPDNNIDDDGNGYVDDYLGWDPTTDNDNIDGGSHGVNVAGMIGAVGNNGVGVSGVNWNVKIMNMEYGSIGSGSNPNEANVIEAYTYPLVMRRLYESTNGQKGAFVVATNSSWGIDNANPLNAPIWCAFYDTLGSAGILSAGATANNNVNIDNVGDLPTACASEYMISVTATNDQDVRTFSGYGATTVDLGAPGEDVRTTASGGGYTTTSGTSFASPATAGAIALMYSAPCASLASIAHADPALAAQMVRDAIFNGVDPVANLTNECVTGGRLNLKGALDEILSSCTSGGCQPPFSVNATAITDNLADISFAYLPDVDTFNIYYGIAGQGSGTLISNLESSPYQLTNLTACTEYWLSMQSVCDGVGSEWTDSIYFNTDGCCEAPDGLVLSDPTDTTISVAWNTVIAANSYQLQWRELGTPSWNTVSPSILGITYVLSDLEPCTDYQIRVASNCAGGTTDYTPSATMRTFGCGACTDLVYCSSSGNTVDEWIDDIAVGDLDNLTGASSNGYEDYTDMSVDLHRGQNYPISLTPDYDGTSFTEHFRIWIDLDQNGSFNASELLFDDQDGTTTTINDSIMIPLTAELGSTRMRISMAYGSNFGGDYPQTSCDEGQYGEVEDYCVNILEEVEDTTVVNLGILEQSGLFGMDVYPVPSSELITVELDASTVYVMLQILDLSGKMVFETTSNSNRTQLNVSGLSSGVYLLQAIDGSATVIGRSRILKE